MIAEPLPLPDTAQNNSMPVVLSTEEYLELEVCEGMIQRGLQTFIEVGMALMTIREKRLYRSQFPTFEAYCLARWTMHARSVNRICAAAVVVQNIRIGAEGKLTTHASVPPPAPGAQGASVLRLPSSESVARPLAGLSAQEQFEVWREAVASAPDGEPTAKHVQSIVSLRKTRPQPVIEAIKPLGCDDELKAAAERAVAGVRELLTRMGTADSAAGANVSIALGTLQGFQEHLKQLERFHANRCEPHLPMGR